MKKTSHNEDRVTKIPVITIDGFSGSGKGTLAKKIANHLQWHYLDSGSLYRVAAYIVLNFISPAGLDSNNNFSEKDTSLLLEEFFSTAIHYAEDNSIYLTDNNEQLDITGKIRGEEIGALASKLAKLESVRETLLYFQRRTLKLPGLVTDGRDMGTVVFPNADVKLFLTADLQERALRRFKELNNKEDSVNLADLEKQLAERDERDMGRTTSPLKIAESSHVIDSTFLDEKAVFEDAIKYIKHILNLNS